MYSILFNKVSSWYENPIKKQNLKEKDELTISDL